mmetsp:Transcript_4489/g.10564  ORF Transcript_4489/g.10564 Transcript_4489/m.10564 type:complete len:206 (+) Transcript_4489:496-1113(+)
MLARWATSGCAGCRGRLAYSFGAVVLGTSTAAASGDLRESWGHGWHGRNGLGAHGCTADRLKLLVLTCPSLLLRGARALRGGSIFGGEGGVLPDRWHIGSSEGSRLCNCLRLRSTSSTRVATSPTRWPFLRRAWLLRLRNLLYLLSPEWYQGWCLEACVWLAHILPQPPFASGCGLPSSLTGSGQLHRIRDRRPSFRTDAWHACG